MCGLPGVEVGSGGCMNIIPYVRLADNGSVIARVADIPNLAGAMTVGNNIVVPHAMFVDILTSHHGCPCRHAQRRVGAAPPKGDPCCWSGKMNKMYGLSAVAISSFLTHLLSFPAPYSNLLVP